MEKDARTRRNRIAGRAAIAVSLAAVVAVGMKGEEPVENGPEAPRYSCAENVDGYVTQHLGKEVVSAVLGVRTDSEQQMPAEDNTVAIVGTESQATLYTSHGTRTIFPHAVEVGTVVELPELQDATMQIGRQNGELVIGVGCRPEALDGPVFALDDNLETAPPMATQAAQAATRQ